MVSRFYDSLSLSLKKRWVGCGGLVDAEAPRPSTKLPLYLKAEEDEAAEFQMVQMAIAMVGRKLPPLVRCFGTIHPGGSAAALSHASALRGPLPFLNRHTIYYVVTSWSWNKMKFYLQGSNQRDLQGAGLPHRPRRPHPPGRSVSLIAGTFSETFLGSRVEIELATMSASKYTCLCIILLQLLHLQGFFIFQ
jgi:hypothetical protein